jgi:hypothetical protein
VCRGVSEYVCRDQGRTVISHHWVRAASALSRWSASSARNRKRAPDFSLLRPASFERTRIGRQCSNVFPRSRPKSLRKLLPRFRGTRSGPAANRVGALSRRRTPRGARRHSCRAGTARSGSSTTDPAGNQLRVSPLQRSGFARRMHSYGSCGTFAPVMALIGVTYGMALCRWVPLCQSTNRVTQRVADATSARGIRGYAGVCFSVRNGGSEYGLSSETCGRLYDGITPSHCKVESAAPGHRGRHCPHSRFG